MRHCHEVRIQPHRDIQSVPLKTPKNPKFIQEPYSNAKSIKTRESSLKLVSKPKSTDIQNQEFLCDHALLYISHIKDPLWQHVCRDFLNMMGPASALKILNCRLGALSPQNKAFDLYCSHEEAARLTKEYDFVILGTLRNYFPALQALHPIIY